MTFELKLRPTTLRAVKEALADGLLAMCTEMLRSTRTPGAGADEAGGAPHGELAQNGAALVYIDGQEHGHFALDGSHPQLPAHAQIPDGVGAIVGFGFPARFNELGTIHQPARPFFSPAAAEVVPRAPSLVGNASQARLRAVP